MKKLTAMLLAGAMVLSLAACGGNSNSNSSNTSSPAPANSSAASAATGYEDLEPVELIGGDNGSKGAVAQLLGELITEKVAEITGGQLTIDYHPNGDLGSDADMLRQSQAGDLNLVVCQTAQVVPFVSEMAVFDLPMVFSKYDADTIDKVLNSSDSAFNQEISSAYENGGFHLLGFLQNATYRLTTSNSALNTLADFKGLQIRTMENANHMAFWTAIGAEPTPLTWGEVYISLQNGTIDAQENAADTCAGANLQEVQKYLACTNHILYCNQVSIDAATYDSLDPLYQAALDQAVAEAMAELRPNLEQIDSDNKAKLEEGGMTIIEYDASFYDEVLALSSVQDLYAQIDSDVNGLGTTLQESLANA